MLSRLKWGTVAGGGVEDWIVCVGPGVAGRGGSVEITDGGTDT